MGGSGTFTLEGRNLSVCEGPWIIGEMHEEDSEPQFLPLYLLALGLKVLFHLTVQSLYAVFFSQYQSSGANPP